MTPFVSVDRTRTTASPRFGDLSLIERVVASLEVGIRRLGQHIEALRSATGKRLEQSTKVYQATLALEAERYRRGSHLSNEVATGKALGVILDEFSPNAIFLFEGVNFFSHREGQLIRGDFARHGESGTRLQIYRGALSIEGPDGSHRESFTNEWIELGTRRFLVKLFSDKERVIRQEPVRLSSSDSQRTTR